MSVANGTSISIEAKSANAESEEKNHTASHEGNLLTVDDDDQHIHMGVAVKHKDEVRFMYYIRTGRGKCHGQFFLSAILYIF